MVSMRPQLQTQAEPDRLARPEGALEAEVFLEAFGDGSLGLHYQAGADDQEGRTYPVSPWFVAATLVPVLRGRPFVIRAVPAAGDPGQPDPAGSHHRRGPRAGGAADRR